MATSPDWVYDSFTRVKAEESSATGSRVRWIDGRIWLGQTTGGTYATSSALFLEPGQAVDIYWEIEAWANLTTSEMERPVALGVYLYEDDTDGAGGDAVDGSGNPKHVYYMDVRASANVKYSVSGSTTGKYSGTAKLPADKITKSGTYKALAVLYHQTEAGRPRMSNIGSEDYEFYVDSDQNSKFTSSVLTAGVTAWDTGLAGRMRTIVSVKSLRSTIEASQGYTDTPALKAAFENTFINPKNMRLVASPTASLATDTPAKVLSYVPNTDGSEKTTTTTYAVDTQFTESASDYRARVIVGPNGGQTATPSAEIPDILKKVNNTYTEGRYDVADQGWVAFKELRILKYLDDAVGTLDLARVNRDQIAVATSVSARYGEGLTLSDGPSSGQHGQLKTVESSIMRNSGDLTTLMAFVPSSTSMSAALARVWTANSNYYFFIRIVSGKIQILHDWGSSTSFNTTANIATGLNVLKVRRNNTSSTVDGVPAYSYEVDLNGTVETFTYTDATNEETTTGGSLEIGIPTDTGTITHHEYRQWNSLLTKTTLDSVADPNGSYTGLEGTEAAAYFFEAPAATESYLTNFTVEGIAYGASAVSSLSVGHKIDLIPLVAADYTSPNGIGNALYNRGEAFGANVRFKNVHGTEIHPKCEVGVVTQAGAVECTEDYTVTPPASTDPYAISYTIASNHVSATVTTYTPPAGSTNDYWKYVFVRPTHYAANNPYQTNLVFSNAAYYPGTGTDALFALSDKLLIGSAAGLDDKAVATTHTLYNRGETVDPSFYLSFARGDALASVTGATIWQYNSDNTILATHSSVSTSATGLVSLTHTLAQDVPATADSVGDQKHIRGSWQGNSPTVSNSYKVSRKYRYGSTNTGPNDQILTGKENGFTTEKTIFNRSQTAHYRAYLYNIRGTLLANEPVQWGVRYTNSETYEKALAASTLATGQLSGASSTFSTSATVAGRALVVGDDSASASFPRTGTGGVGNFAESTLTTPYDFEVTDQLTISCHAQTSSIYDPATAATNFTIGEDVIYSFGKVTDAHGDPVGGVSVLMEQISPEGIIRQSETRTTLTSGANLGVTDPAAGFDTRPPKGSGWTQRCTVSNWNGNTGTDTHSVTMLSAFTANKNPIILFGPAAGVPNVDTTVPTARSGDVGVAGDRMIVGFGYMLNGLRTPPDNTPTPQFMLSTFNQSYLHADGVTRGRVEILQADGTWKGKQDTGYEQKYWDFPAGLEPATANGTDYLEYVCNFGTAAQGVTTSNGYVLDTSNWPHRQIVVTLDFHYESQGFNDDERFLFGERVFNDPRRTLVVGAGNLNAPGTHWVAGMPLTIGAALTKVGLDAEKIGWKANSTGAVDNAAVSLHRITASGTSEYLGLDANSNLVWKTGNIAHQFAMSASPYDAKLALKQFSATETAGWGNLDIFALVRLVDENDQPYVKSHQITNVDSKNRHDKDAFDGVAFTTGFPFK